MKQILAHLFEHKYFNQQEAYDILTRITSGEFNASQIAAFTTAYSMRSISVEELDGFRKAMLDRALKIDFGGRPLIDLCGTGGDGKDTFNISTLSAFVVAGAGYHVAKHGNYGVSSGCGSSNVMEFLGYTFTNDAKRLNEQLDKSGICFLHAPLFHPAMKSVAPIRKELGVKTFFNMLGPLTNPAQPAYQCVGVFSLELARLYGYLLQRSTTQYQIIHAMDGYDEISLTGDFKVISNHGEKQFSPASLGLPTVHASEIGGGENVAASAAIFLKVLLGEASQAQENVVLANASMAIQTIHPDKSFETCLDEARESLHGKKALKAFENLLKN